MTPILIVAAIGFGWAAGFITGHAYAVWSRTRFIHSLMPASGDHTDFVEDDADDCGCRRVRVRRGVRGRGLHSQGDI